LGGSCPDRRALGSSRLPAWKNPPSPWLVCNGFAATLSQGVWAQRRTGTGWLVLRRFLGVRRCLRDEPCPHPLSGTAKPVATGGALGIHDIAIQLSPIVATPISSVPHWPGSFRTLVSSNRRSTPRAAQTPVPTQAKRPTNAPTKPRIVNGRSSFMMQALLGATSL